MNRRSLLVAALVVPCFAFAQETDTDIGASVPGMNVNIRIKDGNRGGPAARAVVHQEQRGDGFRVAWDTDPDNDTWFKVLSPEGASVRVLDPNNFPVASGTVPVSFQARGKAFYSVEIRTGAGVFTKKFEARDGMVTQVWVLAPTTVIVQAEPVGACGPESDLQAVTAGIEEESFSAGKLRVLEDAMSARGVCVDHAVRLMKLFDFEADKIAALKLMAPRLTDRQNKFKIYKAFDFDASRDEAKKILK